MEKFKAINNNPELLENFKMKFKNELDKIRQMKVNNMIQSKIHKLLIAKSKSEKEKYEQEINSIQSDFSLNIPHTFENLMDLFVTSLKHRQITEKISNEFMELKILEKQNQTSTK